MAQEFGSIESALAAGPAALLSAKGRLKLKPKAVAFLEEGHELEALGVEALERAARAGAEVVLAEEAGYPTELRNLPHPPAVLYVRGRIARGLRRVAVVGSRDVPEKDLQIAHAFGAAFARAQVEVVSGGARGIDSAAHEGALMGGGSTLAVLGSGIDVIYPPENAELFDAIATSGAVLSEFPPGTPPQPVNFPQRNRTVAAMSAALVLVRAAMRSGALITAEHAARLSRRLFAVPGPVHAPLAEGPNALLRKGAATPARDAFDVVRALGWPVVAEAGTTEQAPRCPTTVEPESPPSLSAEAERVFRLLDESRPSHVDEVALRAQIPAQKALRTLAELELLGMVSQRPGKFFLRR
jgi:DNA processing protein